MHIISNRHMLLLGSVLLGSIMALPANGQAQASSASGPSLSRRIGILPTPILSVAQPPDGSLYTTYSFANNYTTLNWNVCDVSSACHGSGNLGPFGHVGAVIEGNETITGRNVTRDIYVVDDAAGSGNNVMLYVYTKTDVLASGGDTVTVSLANSVALPLIGGSNTKTYIAGDNGFLFIGTNQTQFAIELLESNMAYHEVGGFSSPEYDSSITANKYGAVTTTFGNSYGSSGFITFVPTGDGGGDGGGGDFMLGTLDGISTANGNFITSVIAPNVAARMKVDFKNRAAPRTKMAGAASPPDSTLYTQYSFWNSYRSMAWVVCGSTEGSEGCYGSGNLGPFAHVGAAMEGNETVNGNTVTRNIYVVDDAAGSGNGVTLYVYQKTDTVSSSYDSTTANLVNTVALPLTGGSNTKTYLAGDNGFLYIGTNQNPYAVQVQESNLTDKKVASSPSGGNVSSITADKYGYVAITSTDNSGGSSFDVYGDSGQLVKSSDGGNFMAGTMRGISTADIVSGTGLSLHKKTSSGKSAP